MPASWQAEDLRAAEIAAIGNGLNILGLQNSLRLPCHIGQLSPILSRWASLMRDDQVMNGIDRDLHIVADDAGAASAGCHRTAVKSVRDIC